MSVLAYIDAKDVRALIDYPQLMDALEAGHRQPMARHDSVYISHGSKERPEDLFLLLGAWQPGAALGVKLVTSFPSNGPRGTGAETVHATVVLFSDHDGTPLCVLDGTEVTFRKTAADSALGARFLAREDAQVLLMVGAGALAYDVVLAHLAARPSIRRVLIWNRSFEKAETLATRLGEEGIATEATDDLDSAVSEADVISSATGSQIPLIKGALLKPGTHLDLIGGFRPDMRETDDDCVRRARIFVDSRPHPEEDTGDLCQPIKAGIITKADIQGDLFDLSQGRIKGRTRPDDITFFKNAGGGHLDLIVALALFEAHKNKGLAGA